MTCRLLGYQPERPKFEEEYYKILEQILEDLHKEKVRSIIRSLNEEKKD